MTKESTVPDPRGTDRERALFLDLLWDDAIEKQVERRAEAQLKELKKQLISDMDDRRARNLKLDIAEVEALKQTFMSEGFYKGLMYGVSGSLFAAFLLAIATHHH